MPRRNQNSGAAPEYALLQFTKNTFAHLGIYELSNGHGTVEFFKPRIEKNEVGASMLIADLITIKRTNYHADSGYPPSVLWLESAASITMMEWLMFPELFAEDERPNQ